MTGALGCRSRDGRGGGLSASAAFLALMASAGCGGLRISWGAPATIEPCSASPSDLVWGVDLPRAGADEHLEGSGTGLPAIGWQRAASGLAHSVSVPYWDPPAEPEDGRGLGSDFWLAGVLPAGWLGMTGVEADLEVAELGREMSMVTMGNGIPPLSLTLARTSWRDPELGTTVSETRIDLGTGWYLTPYGDRGERGYAWRWAAGLSWVRLDLAGSDKDMRALGCFGRMGLLLGAWRSCEAEIRGSVHGWVGGDDHGIQAAAEVVVGFGVAKTF